MVGLRTYPGLRKDEDFLCKNYSATGSVSVFVNTCFFIRTSKFCRGSLFRLISFLFLWAIWNEKSKQTDKALKNNADRLCFEEIPVHLSQTTDHCAFCPLLQSSLTGCRAEANFLLPNYFTRFSKVLTRNIYTFFSLSLFLNCS